MIDGQAARKIARIFSVAASLAGRGRTGAAGARGMLHGLVYMVRAELVLAGKEKNQESRLPVETGLDPSPETRQVSLRGIVTGNPCRPPRAPRSSEKQKRHGRSEDVRIRNQAGSRPPGRADVFPHPRTGPIHAR